MKAPLPELIQNNGLESNSCIGKKTGSFVHKPPLFCVHNSHWQNSTYHKLQQAVAQVAKPLGRVGQVAAWQFDPEGVGVTRQLIDQNLVGDGVLDRNLYGGGSLGDRNYDGGGVVGDRNLVVCGVSGNLGEWEDDRLSFVTGFSDESNLSEWDLSSSDVGQYQSSLSSLCFSGGIDEEDQIYVLRGRPVAAQPFMHRSLSRKLVEANESVQSACSSGVIFCAKDLQHECGDHRPSRSIFEKAVKLETALSRGTETISAESENYVDLLALKVGEPKSSVGDRQVELKNVGTETGVTETGGVVVDGTENCERLTEDLVVVVEVTEISKGATENVSVSVEDSSIGGDLCNALLQGISRVNLPVFCGTDKVEFEGWLERFENLLMADYPKVSEEQKMAILMSTLSGLAYSSVKASGKKEDIYAGCIDRLPAAFRIGTLQELKAEQELDELYQMPNESIHAFSVKVMELVPRANPSDQEAEIQKKILPYQGPACLHPKGRWCEFVRDRNDFGDRRRVSFVESDRHSGGIMKRETGYDREMYRGDFDPFQSNFDRPSGRYCGRPSENYGMRRGPVRRNFGGGYSQNART
uniref:Uncharacterized protein n=1 Tax=Ditylenchus dipsaci TaxID=166011 RepID=A0A915CXC7_9BILA